MYLILGGLGIQGQAILHYLMTQTKEDITIVDLKKSLPEKIANQYKHRADYDRLEYWHGPGWEMDLLDKFGNLTLISCLPTEYNLSVTRTCIANGWNMVDLGGVTSIVKQQFQEEIEALTRRVTIIPDCGLAPGIVASLAGFYQREGWDSIEIFCGGIPKFPKLPLSYSKMFYPAGVIKEFSGLAQEIRDGKLVNVPARSNKELLFIPGFGVLEAVVTSGGLSVAPEHLKLKNLSYKTLRYPGHMEYLEKYILSQPDPIATLDGMLEEVGPDNPDVIILCVRLYGFDTQASREFYWEYDGDTGFSAMSQATGYTVAAIATMVHEKTVRAGVVGMHELDAEEIIRRTQLMPGQYCEDPLNF